ncbi:MAG TPA: biotin--[acetyl-CoA-carboxylase] ligase [Hyphomicrobiales bacterium]|nr:biotin--[acetyl-CoA-carboxylase] ligase [Kaistiaceae bacterium]HQF30138.1 biotin--[acetyl-CoA-carboxylase] ligase [Hyphomicrobiales bacterium]
MSANLRPIAAVPRIALDEVDSTNAEALCRLAAGETAPFWLTAGRQVAGRGRRGRSWTSEPGNLYSSLVLVEPAPAEHLGALPLVVGLGVHRAVAGLAGLDPARLRVKWPNDVLLDGKKIAGILIEANEIAGRRTVVVGIGVNCAHHPEGTEWPATSLAAAGLAVSPDEVFACLAGSLAATLAEWDRGAGLAAIRRAWLDIASGLGEPIVVRLPQSTVSGHFSTIDRDGRLVLRLASGEERRIAAGDVFLPGTGPADSGADEARGGAA